jgi:hypothetical protein
MSSTLSLLNAGGFGGQKVQLALPRSAISRMGNEDYFEVQPRIRRSPAVTVFSACIYQSYATVCLREPPLRHRLPYTTAKCCHGSLVMRRCFEK